MSKIFVFRPDFFLSWSWIRRRIFITDFFDLLVRLHQRTTTFVDLPPQVHRTATVATAATAATAAAAVGLLGLTTKVVLLAGKVDCLWACNICWNVFPPSKAAVDFVTKLVLLKLNEVI